MSDKWTPKQRFDDTIQYLASVDASLAAHVKIHLPVSETVAGTNLSLAGNPRYAVFGSSGVGRAVRALRLCQMAYLGSNWAKQTGGATGIANNLNSANGASLTMDTYLNKSEAMARDAIQAYVALHPAVTAVADAAELVKNGIGPINPPFEKMTRAQNPFPSGQVCFNCVYWWLFKSGFVSLRWILHKGMALGAENANTFLGAGTPITVGVNGQVHGIARGTVLNWRGDQHDTKDICHWAVALGDDFAAGANNSLAGKIKGATKDQDRDVDVTFRHGTVMRTMQHEDSKFGVFRIADMNQVYAGIKSTSNSSGRTGFVLAGIDPNTIPHRDSGD